MLRRTPARAALDSRVARTTTAIPMRVFDMAPSRAKPHRVMVSITTIYGAHFGGIECVCGLCFAGNLERHEAPPVVRTTFPQIAGVGGGEFTLSTPMHLSGIVTPQLCLP